MTRSFPALPLAPTARPFAIGALLALLLLLLLPACRPADGAQPAADATAPASSATTAEAARAQPPSDFSLHELPARWLDQDGAEVALADVAAPVRLVSMVYTHCSHSCPLIIAELQRIEAAIPAGQRDRVKVVLVSLDPARDTPARLREYAESVRLDGARWRLLTGRETDVRALATLLDIRYRPMDAGELAHSNIVIVLDADGRIVHRQEGLGDGTTATTAAVQRLLR